MKRTLIIAIGASCTISLTWIMFTGLIAYHFTKMSLVSFIINFTVLLFLMKMLIATKQKSIVLYLLLCIITIVGLGTVIYFLKNDNVVYYASEQFPLDGNHTYILKKNIGLKDNNGKTIVPAETNYVIIVPGSNELWEDFGVNGTTVGSTDVNLQPYVGHKVKIKGYHYDGATLILPHEGNLPKHYGKNWAVIHINSIKIAN